MNGGFSFINADDIPEALSLGDIKGMSELSDHLAHASLTHGLYILADGVSDHTCATIDINDDTLDEGPKWLSDGVQGYLAYEQAMMHNFAVIRATMQRQGFPVELDVPAHND